jgi:[ribosomal protein S5]-alanine N-acetyltransferase
MRLVTENLNIKPLNLYELEALINGLQTSEELDFALLPNRYRNQLFADCLMNDIRNNINKHPQDYLFYTIWLIINKDNKNVSGHMFFNGCPDACGEVELYSEIFEEALEHAYLRESLDAILSWAANVSRIKLIRTNVPVNDMFMSRIMREAGFEKISGYQHFENWIWKNGKN